MGRARRSGPARLTEDVIRECGGLPLALAAFGAAVRQSGLDWEKGLAALRRRKLNDLARPIEGYDGSEGVFGAIALSFEALSEADRAAFARCAIFPEDRPIPVTALAALLHDHPELGGDGTS